MDAGDAAGHEDKAGARELGRRLEIHSVLNGRNLVMFPGVEGEIAGAAPAVDFHVVGLVLADGRVVVGAVRQRREHVAQGGILGLGLLLHPGDFVFLFSN